MSREYKLTAREREEAIASAERLAAELQQMKVERDARRAEAAGTTDPVDLGLAVFAIVALGAVGLWIGAWLVW